MKRQSFFRLTQEQAEQLAERYQTPLLVLSIEQVEKNYCFLKKWLPNVQIYYAMKANPDREIVKKMAELGSCFDVASAGEIAELVELGISGERMIYANPIKNKQGFQVCNEVGVRKFTFDSYSEIGKMAKASPGASVLLRVRIDNSGAHVDLNKKFGASQEDVLPMLKAAKEAGLDVAGLCFHVGSQTTSAVPYIKALNIMKELFYKAKLEGFDLRILDIGGGFPIPEPHLLELDLTEMLTEINTYLLENFAEIEIWSEPGRFICGTAVNLLTRVIGINERENQVWYFLDDGLYGTFSGVLFDHWTFQIQSFREGEKIRATFAGPSCDSLDVLYRDYLTIPLALDELLIVPDCGAYTSASSTVFNGFAKTPRVIWEEIK